MTLRCLACDRPVAISQTGRPYHSDNGVAGWVDDPTGRDAAHRVVLQEHPYDCGYCASGELMVHNYEPNYGNSES